MHEASFLICQETQKNTPLPLCVSQEGEKGNRERFMNINKAIFWLAESLEIINDGMFYLSTSPHCKRQIVSTTPLQKITTKAGGGVLSIFLHSEQLHKYRNSLFSYEDKNMSFFQYNSERQHETLPKPSRIQVPALTTTTTKRQTKNIKTLRRLTSQACQG